MKIAADVLAKLKKLAEGGKLAEEELVQRLVEDNTLRYKKEVLRPMVKEFMLQLRTKE